MFTEDTVFILGAGASWHYGYPTGEELVKRVKDKAKSFAEDISYEMLHPTRRDGHGRRIPKIYNEQIPNFEFNNGRNQIIQNCRVLAERISYSNAVVIDDFLSMQNEEIRELGKFFIAWVILDCEAQYFNLLRSSGIKNCNSNRNGKDGPLENCKDDWCRFLLHEIVSGCQKSEDASCSNNSHSLLDNKVKFITFNYDVSLEKALSDGLNAHSDFFNQDEMGRFFDGRFIHMYGQVRENNLSHNFQPIQVDWGQNLDADLYAIYEASCMIRTIENVDKQDEAVFKQARTAIESAKRIFILGFGFDDRNCERLGFNNDFVSNSACQSICFTNYGDSDKINKRVNKLFGLGDYFYRGGNNFLRRGTVIPNTFRSCGVSFERSTVDVYRALAEDIDL